MRVVGVTAEYNPFHGGHARQLAGLRRLHGEDTAVVAALSGDFVQRGEAAVFSKFARAEAAVRCGVSLVLELPLPWCVASAEGFARGAVGLFRDTGVVEELSFGSESGDEGALRRAAPVLEDPAFPAALRRELERGDSFAAARSRAVAALGGAEAALPLEEPNDILGVEYLRSMGSLGFSVPVSVIPREGSSHHGPDSAGALRALMAAGEEWLSALPAPAAAVFERERREGRGPVLPEHLRLPLLSRLRERSREELSLLPDAGEGLENRLYDAIRKSASPEEAAALAKSKRYALSRLRRMLLCAALGISGGMGEGTPPYLRVLAMDERGAALLRVMRRAARIPVLVKAAHVRKTDPRAEEIFALNSAAHDLYVLGYETPDAQRAGEDPRRGPYIHAT